MNPYDPLGILSSPKPLRPRDVSSAQRAALEEIERLTDTGVGDPWKILEQVRARARAALGKENIPDER